MDSKLVGIVAETLAGDRVINRSQQDPDREDLIRQAAERIVAAIEAYNGRAKVSFSGTASVTSGTGLIR